MCHWILITISTLTKINNMIMEKIIKLAEVISTDIRSRANAEILKNQISSGNDIMLDFEGVTFISRSFADELYNLTEHVNANVGNV